MQKRIAIILGRIISLPTFAHHDYKAMSTMAEECKPPVQIVLGVHEGYSFMQGAYSQDGQTPFQSNDVGVKINNFYQVAVGMEMGGQTGNNLRLTASSVVINEAGGLPLQATLKPTVVALVSLSAKLNPELPVYGVLKGGIAYRQLSLQNRTSQRDSIRKVDGEFQAGLAVNMSKHSTFSMLYQGIYGGSGGVGAALSSTNYFTLKHMPTQNNMKAGLAYKI